MKKDQLLRKLEAKELRIRCLAVNMCPECGKDLKNISHPGSHWTELACPNEKCKIHGKIIKTRN